MNWSELIAEIAAVDSGGSANPPVTGIEYDSRRVRPGAVFVAMKGGSTDGNRYIDKAIAAGAAGIITDSAQAFDHMLVYNPGTPVVAVEHGRGLCGLLRPSGAQARSHGHHGHKRQNHRGVPDRIAAQRR
jgi:UDP-N-acetylmuramoyl-L-alanyl-D-glutamate--2,6-diaminopimelate ligase